MIDETAWLVERRMPDGSPEWFAAFELVGLFDGDRLTGRRLQSRWSTDPNDVLRFAREEDAYRLLPALESIYGGSYLVTEHVWCSGGVD